MNALTLSKDDLWKQYEISIDLYKHYLKLTIEINIFYYAITGAIVSYYFAHRMESPDIRFSLLLPILMSVLLALFFIYGSIMNRHSRDEMFRVRDALGLRVSPEFAVLSWLLVIFAALMVLVALSLGAILLGCVNVA
jgi:hypothetical protein